MATKTKRKSTQLREITIRRGYITSAPGSVLFSMGNTRVICTATIEDGVPHFLRGKGKGWITAEYGMLPRSSPQRIQRESARGRVNGRTQEIQRLIGRSLRSIVDMEALGERTITVDCDVLEADGGTRTASINGGFMALAGALRAQKLDRAVLKGVVAAVSVGISKGRVVLDLDYESDSTADVDMNVVMDDSGRFIEIQGTAEKEAFDRGQLDRMLAAASAGIRAIMETQKKGLRRK
jgi:ribonuclease PH